MTVSTDIEEVRSIRATAHALADAARVATLRHFRTMDLDVSDKTIEEGGRPGFDPVTRADREAEAAMREILARDRPDDAILGEEYGATQGTSGWTWILDPVDGTRAFMAGAPTWGVLVAASRGGRAVYGLIDQPHIGERFEGGFGHARLDGPGGGRLLATRAPRPLSEATLLTTFPEVGTPEEGRAFHAVSARARLTRYGFDCYGYALVALGQVDLVIEAGLAPYDIAGPLAVIEAAGGIVTDWTGGDASNGGRVIAAANAAIHAEALAILRDAV